MLRMESNHSDTSLNSSERASSAWVKLWNASYNSTTAGLSIGENGSATDLASAIGDKEVAAKAVAFVVNSTRKGIVTLCADVANLLRHKKSLEEKILQIIKENEALRLLNDERCSLTGSTVTRSKQSEPIDEFCLSAPTSPTEPAALPQKKASRIKRHTKVHDHIVTLNHTTSSPPEYSFMPVTPATESSPRVDNQVIIHPKPSDEQHEQSPCTEITVAEVHVSSDSAQADYKPPDWSTRPVRTPSLSSSERGSDRSLELSTVNVQEKRSTSTIARKLNRTVLSNNKLTEELDAARATIEKLQREVRDLRVLFKNNNHNGADVGVPALRLGAVPDVLLPSQRRRTSSRSETVGRANPSPSCHICTEAWHAASINGAVLPRLYTHDDVTLFTSENMLVSIEDSVLTNSNQCGMVRYIGHLDGLAPTSLFVGLQLADKVQGGIDGTFNGKRYFTCPKGCGLFIPAQDIVNVITKKQASVLHKSKKPAAVTSCPDKSITSSSNSGSTGGFVRKLRRAAVSIRHTHSQKRISLPGDPNQTTEPGQSTEVVNNQPKEGPSTANHRRTHSTEEALPEGIV